MRLRKLLLAASAIVAAGAMAIAPAAMAGPPNGVTVGTNTTGNHAISLVFKSATVTIKVYGITTNITCTGGSASGTANAGASVTNSATITALSLTCPSIFPGTTVTMSATCPIQLQANSGYTAALGDPAVAGTLLFNNCAAISISNGCTFTIGGSAGATFDERAKSKPVGTVQDIAISSTTATINNVSGCLGAVTNGQTFTLTLLFNVVSSAGLINIIP